jgi:Zn-dependent protease
MDLTRGAFRLFRAAGTDVYLHWLWFVVAWWQLTTPDSFVQGRYHATSWKVAEYLSLFFIVLLHEFGHVLACRSVGGRADKIVLWPLGGVAYVAPPPRPGAVLWSIAAGPLVNVALVVPTFALVAVAVAQGWRQTAHDPAVFLQSLAWMNVALLLLNLLPVYPLDGGQILQALLWFRMGRWHSLQFVSLVGIGAGAMLFVFSLFLTVLWGPPALMLGLVAGFMVLQSFLALQQSRSVLHLLGLPRHDGCACPHCAIGPPKGRYWVCEHCQTRFDTFDTRGKCPACGAWYLEPQCPHCRHSTHIDRWFEPAPLALGATAEPPA